MRSIVTPFRVSEITRDTAALAGDLKAAARVELELPQTGVCNTSAVPRKAVTAASACCTSQGVCCAPKPELTAGTLCCGESAPVLEPVTESDACCARPAVGVR